MQKKYTTKAAADLVMAETHRRLAEIEAELHLAMGELARAGKLTQAAVDALVQRAVARVEALQADGDAMLERAEAATGTRWH